MLTAPNACPAIHGNAFLFMAMVFRIQTQCVVDKREELRYQVEQTKRLVDENILHVDEIIGMLNKSLEFAEAKLNEIGRATKAEAQRQEEERRARAGRRNIYAFIGDAFRILNIAMLTYATCGVLRVYFQAQNEPPHPTTTREASPVGRVAQQAPGPDRRRSPRLHRQLRVSRVSQGDSQPMG